MTGHLVVIGDALLDVDIIGSVDRVSPEAPVPVVENAASRRRPGGAALAATFAATDHPDVVLIAPFADDQGGRYLQASLADRVRVLPVPWTGSTSVKTRLRAGSHPIARFDTGGRSGSFGDLPDLATEILADADAVLVSDYAGGFTDLLPVRQLIAAHRGPFVWDPHKRGATPLPGAAMVTPNLAEAEAATTSIVGTGLTAARKRADALVKLWSANAVALTMGELGALLSYGEGSPLLIPATAVAGQDTCGAGDCFAAAVTVALAFGAVPSEAIARGVASASAYVRAGGAAGVSECHSEPRRGQGPAGRSESAALIEKVRARGGRVIATGGCFDLLHAGHVAMLQTARSCGDCLVVCVNSDASVRRLKGATRPIQDEQSRRRVLDALECVDAVELFDEDTPERVIRELRPDVWVKGGDYAGTVLAESSVMQEWGGEAITVPYVSGLSTTGLVARARQNDQF